MFDWQDLLHRWNKLPQDPTSFSKSEVSTGATSEQIDEMEARLGVRLPQSYRNFLLTSNGGLVVNDECRLRAADEVDWFSVENESWIEAWCDDDDSILDFQYFDYTDTGYPDFRRLHLKNTLQISDIGDGVFLLNPNAATPDGEWEGWFFANWIPGANRYPSFLHMMVQHYGFLADQGEANISDIPDVPAPTIPRHSVKRQKTLTSRILSMEELLPLMQSSDTLVRKKAERMAQKKLKGRFNASLRPDLVEPISALFYTSLDNSVRATCIQLLTELAAEPAPKPLFDALLDSDPDVFLRGVAALSYFPDPRAWEILCNFVEHGELKVSVHVLAYLVKQHDERIIPLLEKLLLQTTYDERPQVLRERITHTSAMALAKFGSQGFKILATALKHSDQSIRYAAVVGLAESRDERRTALLDQMVNDTDPHVSQRAKMRVGR